jgi:hypothetical protein
MTHDRGERWLALVVAALLVAAPVAAADAAQEPDDGGRERIVEQLVGIGRAPAQAREAAARLTAEDLEVLLAHPDMMQAAGGLEMTFGVLLVVGVIVGLAIAGSTIIVISV